MPPTGGQECPSEQGWDTTVPVTHTTEPVSLLDLFNTFNLSTRELSLGTAYAVWTGIGAFGTAAVGILFFGDPATFWRLVFLTTLIGSLVGLKYVS